MLFLLAATGFSRPTIAPFGRRVSKEDVKKCPTTTSEVFRDL